MSMPKIVAVFAGALILLLQANGAVAEEIFPRIFAGGVSGSDALADPANSDHYRASGGGLYVHAVGWDRMSAAQKNATLANFYGNDTVVEVGSSESQANWYLDRIHNKGVRAKVITINAFSSGRIPTVSGWNGLLAYYRSNGVDENTQLYATFEYQNFSSNIATLSDNEVSDRADFQQIIAASGGMTLDVPAHYYFDREQAYRDWVHDAINWAHDHHYSVMIIASPRFSGTNFHNDLRDFVDALAYEGALPNIFAVENYSTEDPSTYPNIVGSEDVPYQQLGAARLLQTQYLPAVVGRSLDKDGDAKAGSSEAALGRSDFDPSDLTFDFASSGNTEGWMAENITGLSVSAGLLSGITTGIDPRLTNSGVYIDGGRSKNIIVRMRASASGALQVYWGTDPGGIAADNYKAVSYNTPGQWAIRLLRLDSNPKWKGRRISALRVDPISVAGSDFAIDWIAMSDGDYDRDGLADHVEGFSDFNGDGTPDAMDVDSDGDGVTDDREGVIGRDRLEPSDMYFGGTTQLAGSSEGWTAVNVDGFIAGGAEFLAGTARNNDPQFRRSGFHFPGASASQIRVRYRAPVTANLQLYWGILGSDVYTASRAATASYTTPGQWQTVTFNLSGKPAWTNETITSIRIDPVTVAGIEFAIDSISAAP